MHRRWRALVPVAGLLLLTVPALAFWLAGWIHIARPEGSLTEHGAIKDTTSIYVWALLAVVYLFWVLGLLVVGIWFMDHLGYHWEPYDRPQRKSRRERRRMKAGLGYARGQHETARKAELAAVAREAKRAAAEPDDEPRHAGASRPGEQPRQRPTGSRRASAPAQPGAPNGAPQRPPAQTQRVEPASPRESPPEKTTDEGD